jgi:hypothetical protein
VTLDNALEALALCPAPDIKVCIIIEEVNCYDITSLVFAVFES